MAKTVTIPADVSRMEITINNKTYTYPGGATVSVPNEVAALIENNAANKPGGIRPASEPLNAAGLYDGDDYIAVYTRPDGTLCVKKSDIASAVGNELPDFPDTDGTYSLQAVTDNGETALSWEAVPVDNAEASEAGT